MEKNEKEKRNNENDDIIRQYININKELKSNSVYFLESINKIKTTSSELFGNIDWMKNNNENLDIEIGFMRIKLMDLKSLSE